MGERVFEKFTRGEKESAKPGIGLGLAICRAIVEAHGGTIGAANRVDADGRVVGASFWFALPVEEPPPLPADVHDDNADDHAEDPHDSHDPHDGPTKPLDSNAAHE
jgi:two-component system sensor histidine kinase KdpD